MKAEPQTSMIPIIRKQLNPQQTILQANVEAMNIKQMCAKMKYLRSLLNEVETSKQEMNQSWDDGEIMDCNHDSESKFEKSDEREAFESKEEMLSKGLHQKKI
ncbi:hypothetical protein TNCV_2206871 [Trichonephila clavipes]|uniref:Uncharacterized protein n=1 Tax=Trichonephila clavipes TaxID=2585209 RepID=A0A8X6SB43_TRICX|nr:hypothetical protein TNCV_2206871 [Trichonephila clavipes]